ncbi:ankyrin repeat and MYND domain-containing protein 1 [Balaenoptera acutorostrata]|uniref:Ankyrin repeat and MYND domain-containing protein 1 n=1 Tax=Balaenoptera acutorostrata TaxID=9767 RepID=A0ABM3TXX4_BALAC|nr:ankyrin repeat and MYND domain-containing protein 1 [Balaenoptera acutorostrata]
MLSTKRFIPEAPEGENEEPKGPLREQDLKEAYIELIRGVQEWQDGCVYRGEFGLDVKLGCREFSWPMGEVTSSRGRIHPALFTREPLQQRGNEPQKSATLKLPCKSRCLYSTYSHERVSGRPPACTGLQEELGQQERGPPQDSRRGGRVSTGVAAGQVSREA